MKEKLIVYTAILGGKRGNLRPIRVQREGSSIKFLAFIDGALDSNYGWEVRGPEFRGKEPRRSSRAHKLLPHRLFPNARYSLWIDGCLQVADEAMEDLPDRYLKEHDICVFKHKKRKCVYEELDACLYLNKDDPFLMRDQIDRYRSDGYPERNGLSENTAILRRHTEEVASFNEMWWRELVKGSCRDQLSFNYVAWKLGLKYQTFEGTNMNSPHFNWFKY